MKKQSYFLFFLLIVWFFFFLSCGGKDKDKAKETYPQHLVNSLDKTAKVSAQSQMDNIVKALESYYMDHDEYPSTLAELVPAYIRLESELVDPWQTAFKFENNKLISAGKDKTFATPDDIEKEL